MLYLQAAGIISGYEDGTFKPNNSITREEASMLLYKTAQYMGYNDFYEDYKLSDYKYADDEEIGEWAKEAVYQMNKAEIMTGMGDDMFSPKSNYTNEQSISTIMRLYDLQNKPKSTPTPTLAPTPEPTEVPKSETSSLVVSLNLINLFSLPFIMTDITMLRTQTETDLSRKTVRSGRTIIIVCRLQI